MLIRNRPFQSSVVSLFIIPMPKYGSFLTQLYKSKQCFSMKLLHLVSTQWEETKIITVIIGCEHIASDIRLRISENDICCIQCGLIQIRLSRNQANRVFRHCHCMPSNLYFENPNKQGRATMTIDPSQLDLKGKVVGSWLIG
jgi:hypothetical protein